MHPHQIYGSRLRAFHSRHGITCSRARQTAPLTLQPGPSRRHPLLRALALGLLVIIAIATLEALAIITYVDTPPAHDPASEAPR